MVSTIALIALAVLQSPEPKSEGRRQLVESDVRKIESLWKEQHVAGKPFALPKLQWHKGLKVGDFGLAKSKMFYSDDGMTKHFCTFSVFRRIGTDTIIEATPSGFTRRGGQSFSQPKYVTIEGKGFDDTPAGGSVVIDGAFIADRIHNALGVEYMVLIPIELPRLPSHPAELGIGLRKWSDKTGQFSTNAAFAGYEKGSVDLVKKDGEKISVKLSILSDDDKEFVRNEIRKSREKSAEPEN